MRFFIVPVLAVILLSNPVLAQPGSVAADPQRESLHLNWRDLTVSPADNFFAYANGHWQKMNPVPPEYATWGSFNLLQLKVEKIIHRLLIEAAKHPNPASGSIQQKAGDFYFSGMDEKTINALGVKPLEPEMARIAAIDSREALQSVIAHLQMIGVDALFDFSSMQDFKNSEEMIAAAAQGGLGLPNRDYYLKTGKKFDSIRKAYVEHVTNMFLLLGDSAPQAKQQAETVMRMETILARASLTPAQQRDPQAIYHRMNRKQLRAATPHFSWPAYFAAIGKPKLQEINLAMPGFFKVADEQLHTVPLSDWKTYLRWHLIDAFASYLSEPFVNQNFHMMSQLTGAQTLQPRWKRVVATENAALGFAIGKLYVEQNFPPEAKKEALTILKQVHQALRKDIESLSWMAPETKKAALKKLALMEERVGYPDKWWDYSSLQIDRGPYVLNVIRANQFLIKRELDKIGKPIDRSEWAMPPQTVNAYYDPSMNNITIPAGILQPPFFDQNAAAAVNYGGIGFVMGHEITHGFDDQGAQFDGYGNLKTWWTAADLKKFKAATQCIIDQFSRYKIDDLHVQGQLVAGEATADLGGLTLAYHAFVNSPAYQQASVIDNLTPEQQFFLGTAHVWASNIRPEQARHLITVDPHPPMIYRVNGSMANMPQFITAFAIPANSPMVNKTRCQVW
ncbi:M13 family metallopeptidase [Legionella erythra]|uniref:Metallopeptidase PepO, peptidase, M13 family n=1 Tax=Legionella erythra TaxID=448 RepID=A0A0W0TRX5_LEGER|nr:M13 family metallopeptidase [Legionella erythra]KTC98381.1 metallopeptidase PepO, peptidase, M13 family [Legionella erythra]